MNSKLLFCGLRLGIIVPVSYSFNQAFSQDLSSGKPNSIFISFFLQEGAYIKQCNGAIV